MAKQRNYDILIVGGGMVGASLASALSGHGLSLAVLEAHPLAAEGQPSYDDRSVALGYGSKRILETLGLWSALDQAGVCPIETIHVSDRGHLGSTRLQAADEGVEALGYVVENRVLGQVFAERFEQMADVDLISPVRIASLDISRSRVRLLARQGEEVLDLTAGLLVAADGGQSLVRQWQGIETFQRDYGQTAIIANVSCAQPHRNIAYERFTDSGPLALLPLSRRPDDADDRCSLVWTVDHDDVAEMMGWDDTGFLERLQARFGHRLGPITQVGARAAYPLRLMQVREAVRQRLAVIGNAAHQLHPVAGQGFNLGLRDVATLAQVLVDAHRQGRDIGEFDSLRDYSRWRRQDTFHTLLFTNTLVEAFSSKLPPLALVRNLGLLATDTVPLLKHSLARQAMGMAGHQTRLARGLPL